MAYILIVLPRAFEKIIHFVGDYLNEKGHHVTYVPDELPLIVQATAAQSFEYTLLYCHQHEKIKEITSHIHKVNSKNACILVLNRALFSLAQLLEYHSTGYLLENFRLSELVLCLSTLSNGDRYISQAIGALLGEFDTALCPTKGQAGLSTRENRIVALLAEGMKSQQIADELGISIYTLHNHKTNIRHKLQLKSNREILFMAIQQARGQNPRLASAT